MQRVVGDRMAGRRCDVNQGSRSGNSDGVHGLQCRSEEPCPEGDRASVRVKKRGNARGAKGGRDVEAEEQKLRPRKAGVVPTRAVRARERIPPEPRSDVCLPRDERRRTKAALSDNVLIPKSDGRSQEPSWSIAWRAGCGRSARPVREGEWRMGSPLLPHHRRHIRRREQ